MGGSILSQQKEDFSAGRAESLGEGVTFPSPEACKQEHGEMFAEGVSAQARRLL